MVATRDGDVGIIRIDRPHVRNALDLAALSALAEAIDGHNQDPAVAVLVLTGTDPAFCAGEDLKAMTSGTFEWPEVGRPWPRSRKPLIGAVNGPAITGGLELALSCDFLIASDQATFADTHVRLGLVPFWGLIGSLSDAVGVRRAREMSLTGRFVPASEAHAWGLVNRVVPHDELMAVALEVARAAAAAADNDALAAFEMAYDAVEDMRLAPGAAVERIFARQRAGTPFDTSDVAAHVAPVMARGREQLFRNGVDN